MDMAWAGATVFRNGAWHYLPGTVRAPVRALTLDDVIEVQLVQLGPDSDDRVNVGLMGIAQDADRGYLPYRLPAQELTDELTIDGARREIDLGQRGFVNTARQAERVLRRKLRETRPSILATLRLMPGPELENMSLHAGDVVTYTDSRYGLEAERCIVQSSTINQDMSVTVALQGTPVLGTSRFTAGSWTPGPTRPRPGKPPKVTGFSVGQLAFSVRVLNFTMPDWSSLSGVRIRYASSDAPWIGMTQLHSGFLIASPFTSLEPTGAGDYYFEARAVSQAGVESDGVRVQATLNAVRDLVDGKDGTPGAKGDKGDPGAAGADGTDGRDGVPGADGTDGRGPEYVFVSSTDGTQVTGDANLPDPDWTFDRPGQETNGRVVRGTRTYWDGTPGDLSNTRPFLIRFRRPVSGDPAVGDNVGTVPWTQDPAIRVYGQDGLAGAKGDKGDSGDDGIRGPGVFHVLVTADEATALRDNDTPTLPTSLDTTADDAVDNEPLGGDFLRFYHDGSDGRENWWYTYNADSAEWRVSQAFISAAQVQAINIQSIRGDFGDINVSGTLSGQHIDADVRNWDRLWGGGVDLSTTATGFNLAASLDDYDNFVVTASRIVTPRKRVAFLPFDAALTTEQEAVGGSNNTGRTIRATRTDTHDVNLSITSGSDVKIESIWGIKNPALASQVPFAPGVKATPGATATANHVDLEWSLSTPNPTIDQWQYQSSSDGGETFGAWTDVPASAGGKQASLRKYRVPSVTVSSLTAFRVRAINPIGNGSTSVAAIADWSVYYQRGAGSYTWPWFATKARVEFAGGGGGEGGDKWFGVPGGNGSAGTATTVTLPNGTRLTAGNGTGGEGRPLSRGAFGGTTNFQQGGNTKTADNGGNGSSSGGRGGPGELREQEVSNLVQGTSVFAYSVGRGGVGGSSDNENLAGEHGGAGWVRITPIT